jgi:PAS domain-containing protein
MFRPPYKSNGQLINELEEMHHLSQEVESCEIQLQKAKEQYENLLGSAPDAMIFIDHFGRIVQANTQFERMFGFEKEEVIGRELDLLIPDRFRIKHRQDVERFLHSPFFP